MARSSIYAFSWHKMSKYDLIFTTPLMNAAGSLGFTPEVRGPIDLTRLGAFVTNPISQGERAPAHGRRCLPYMGGFLLHSGYPNPGLNQVIRRYRAKWGRAALPIIVHILGENPGQVSTAVRRLEGLEGILGIELGLPPEIERSTALELAQVGVGELPLIVRIPLERATELAHTLARLPLAAVSLGPPRGILPGTRAVTTRGRLFGPAIFPQALAAVASLARSSIPVIGAGGIYSLPDAEAMLAEGALAVQVDAVLWISSWLSKTG
jgi:dihydroorotate dehydrogenase